MKIPDGTGRNLRTVWTIATAPFSGSHFATFPPALSERCIKAGTSEAGCCSKCGRQWERVETTESHYEKRQERNYPGMAMVDSTGWKRPTRHPGGFRPTCSCSAPAQPCVVLDPFNGAGTTGLVCQRLGRRYIGLDLSAEYLQMSRERLGHTALEAWENGVNASKADVTDLPLFGGPHE